MTDLYSSFYDKVGQRADIVAGELVVSETGFLEITSFPRLGSVYVDSFNKSVQVIPLKDDFRGYAWDLYNYNCAMCCAHWHDRFFGTDLVFSFRGLSHQERRDVMQTGYQDLFEKFGFVETQQAQLGCIFIYEYPNHLAILVDADKNTILHHPARKLSGLDVVNSEKIIKILCHTKTLQVQ
jgi:hypothetical protein